MAESDYDHRVLELHFFFQAEDGIRDVAVTGVQTCALPILKYRAPRMLFDKVSPTRIAERIDAISCHHGLRERIGPGIAQALRGRYHVVVRTQIGRASCRERV